ncbi:MAG: hypoxanthine phosphoribosyltransferase [Thermodesulfobacteriota bacterium]
MIREIEGRKLKLLFTSKVIQKRVAELGKQISKDYKGEKPVLIGVLKGAFIFLTDLIRHIDLPAQVDFVRISTYKEKMEPGDLEFIMDTTIPLRDRHVILVEDIVDTGITLKFIREKILEKKPDSFKICALLDLKYRREVEVHLDYLGFEVKEGFLVGYGLDMAEEGRVLPDLYLIE